MNIEEQMKLLAMKRTTRSQLHDREGLWEGRLSDICQLMNKNLIRGLESGTRCHRQAMNKSAAVPKNPVIQLFREVRELDSWIRRRMRMFYWTAQSDSSFTMRSQTAEPVGINNGSDRVRGD